MVERTVIIVGPGGVGKSPLESLFTTEVSIDPYRLRQQGPDKNKNDMFYAHTQLRRQLEDIFKVFKQSPQEIGCIGDDPILWYTRAKTLIFKVRKEDQILILLGIKGKSAKAEIYAPVLPFVLATKDVRDVFGKIEIIVLNPVQQSVTTMTNWKELEERTYENCKERGDTEQDSAERVRSVAKEAPVWRKLLVEHAATEYNAWEFPEYLYKKLPQGTTLPEHQKDLLTRAWDCLTEKNERLKEFLMEKSNIRALCAPIVK